MPLVFRLSTPFARCALLVLAVSAVPVGRQAARAEILPSDASFATAERVFVSGVPDTFEKVRAAIARLPTKQRTVLVLRMDQELSHQEIAQILGSSVGAVKANVFHAIQNLKKILPGELG